ncbi:uncharacterized protein BXZ73DRAFT_104868 [Epithele typhae]|uniref:uncharacterized protein n=1 Tax=Epithele typhae TaxID=378194 RepID=UPI002007376C|nr:uncharacterized protein BXZ73DRAFT_104868 [Epithele typhae]KAH9919762.1 hypothetical protein BXZ73DRAFT_104868 [Epithele typhae]
MTHGRRGGTEGPAVVGGFARHDIAAVLADINAVSPHSSVLLSDTSLFYLPKALFCILPSIPSLHLHPIIQSSHDPYSIGEAFAADRSRFAEAGRLTLLKLPPAELARTTPALRVLARSTCKLNPMTS